MVQLYGRVRRARKAAPDDQFLRRPKAVSVAEGPELDALLSSAEQ